MLRDTDLRELVGAAFERSVVATLIVDPEGTVLAANQCADSLLTSGLGSVVGRTTEEFRGPGDARYLDQATLNFRSGAIDHLHRTVELVTPAGDSLCLEVTADAVSSTAGRRLWLVQLDDVTGARRSQRDLEASERHYRQLANSLPESSVLMFDRDLRTTVALGEALVNNGYRSDELVGRLLSEVLPASAFAVLEWRYRAALDGTPSDFEYVSPQTGRRFWTRVMPVTDSDGSIVGGLVLAGDVSVDRERQFSLEQIHRLTPMGSCSFNLATGWTFDENLLQLWGLDNSAQDIDAAFAACVLEEDRFALQAAQERMFLVGGRSSLAYRIRYPPTGEIRRLHCTFESTIHSGTLLNATATHVDVTDAFAENIADSINEQAAIDQRSMLLRKVSDAVAKAQLTPEDYLSSVVELAATDLQAAAMLLVLAPDQQTVQMQAMAHPEERPSTDISRAMGLPRQCFEPGPIRDQVIRQARIVRSTGPDNPPSDPDLAEETARVLTQSITAPIRHGGQVLGLFSVLRDDPRRPFSGGDENLVQVLADFAGAAVAEHRAREGMQREAAHRFADNARQRELLEQLAGMQTRERTRIADSIHASPIQLIVAAAMRVDLLSTSTLQAHSVELDRLAVLLEDSVDWLRSLADIDLAPPNLSRGLIQAMRNLGRTVISPSRHFAVTGPDTITLSAAASAAVYSVVREALLNAEKHAGAQHITISIAQDTRMVTVTVTDDGVGTTGLPGPGHLGLAAMRIRAEAEDGQLTIQSAPGTGTTVVLAVPISQS